MTTEIVYIDRSTIKEGQVEEVRERIQDLVPFIEEREPQLAGYQFFFDEDARRMTVVAIHPDSDSLELHMEVGRSAFAGFADFIDMKAIEVYGNPSEKVLELLEEKANMLGDAGRVEVHTPQGGFMRLPSRTWRDSPNTDTSCPRRVPGSKEMAPDVALSIVPANEASCDDLNAIFGTRGYPARCRCQRFRTTGDEWWHNPISVDERMFRLRQQTDCGYPGSETTSGLVAYLEDEPVGWCAVDRRSEYIRLGQTPWKGRSEDKEDEGVGAVTCFVVRVGYRGQGLTYPLAAAAVGHTRERGATALEAYPMIVEEGQEVTWGELHVGNRRVFEAAGFRQVSHPSKRRCVMRIDF